MRGILGWAWTDQTKMGSGFAIAWAAQKGPPLLEGECVCVCVFVKGSLREPKRKATISFSLGNKSFSRDGYFSWVSCYNSSRRRVQANEGRLCQPIAYFVSHQEWDMLV